MSRMKLGDKALVVAMDHARTLGVVPGLENPDPSRIVMAMKCIIHEGATVNSAARFAGIA
jgi:hypothetical protein